MRHWLCSVGVAVMVVAGGWTASADTLALETFLEQVATAHPALRAARFEPDLAEAEIRNALGRFDPVLHATYEYKDKDGADKLNYLDASVAMPLDMLFGPKIKAGYRRGTGFQINPERQTSEAGEASIGVTLPLFQGIATDARRNALRKAFLRPDMAQAQFRMERNNLLRAAGMAYWTWSEARALVSMLDTLVVLAEERLDQVSRRARAGEIARIDSVELAQEVLRRRGERIRAERSAEQAAIDASVFLWNGDGQPQPLSGLPSALPDITVEAVDDAAAVQRARGARPELVRADVLQQLARLDVDLAREYLRPFIEADASLVGYDVSKGLQPDLKVGFTINQPLLFRSASAQAQVADITVQRADWQRALVERTVDADVRNALVAARRALERREMAVEEVRLARQMVDAERRRLEAGDGTLLLLNLRERFLAEALQRELSARADALRADIALRWATGTLGGQP